MNELEKELEDKLEKLKKMRHELVKNIQMGYGTQTAMPNGGANGTMSNDSSIYKEDYDKKSGDLKEHMEYDAMHAKDHEKQHKKEMKHMKGHVEDEIDEHKKKHHKKDMKKNESYLEIVKFQKNGQWSLNKGLGGDLDAAAMRNRKQAAQAVRQPAKVTDASGTKMVSPESQTADASKVKAKKVTSGKAAAEEAAAARRAKMRSEGVLKGDIIMDPRPASKLDVPVKEVYNGDDHTKAIGGKSVDGDKGKTIHIEKNP